MRSINNKFYKTKEWGNCRAAYIAQHPLCERCLAQGRVEAARIVHHKIHLTEDNVIDPSIALSFDNLESVCMDCHNKEHFGSSVQRRWKFDDQGNLVMSE